MSKEYSLHKSLKKSFSVIASEFSGFFADQTKIKLGIRPDPASIKVQSIEIKNTLGRGRELYLVDISFSSDCGISQTRLFIKTFIDAQKVFQEASGAFHLEELLKHDPFVRTPKLLYYSKEWNILVYEGVNGEDFDSFNAISKVEKYYLAGLALPRLHGSTLKEVDLERYYLLLEKSIFQIKSLISENFPDFIPILELLQKNLVAEVEGKMFYCHGGAFSFGDFHSGNIMFEEVNSKIRFDNRATDNVQIWLIDPEFFEFEIANADRVDRFEDIGNFFAKMLLLEYSQTTKLEESTKLFKIFISGYDYLFKQLTNVYLRDCYPKGTTIEYHISQSLLFDLLYFIRKQNDKDFIRKGFFLRLNLINLILQSKIIK